MRVVAKFSAAPRCLTAKPVKLSGRNTGLPAGPSFVAVVDLNSPQLQWALPFGTGAAQ